MCGAVGPDVRRHPQTGDDEHNLGGEQRDTTPICQDGDESALSVKIGFVDINAS